MRFTSDYKFPNIVIPLGIGIFDLPCNAELLCGHEKIAVILSLEFKVKINALNQLKTKSGSTPKSVNTSIKKLNKLKTRNNQNIVTRKGSRLYLYQNGGL